MTSPQLALKSHLHLHMILWNHLEGLECKFDKMEWAERSDPRFREKHLELNWYMMEHEAIQMKVSEIELQILQWVTSSDYTNSLH